MVQKESEDFLDLMEYQGRSDPRDQKVSVVLLDNKDLVVTLDQVEHEDQLDLLAILVHWVRLDLLASLETVEVLVLKEMLVHLEFPGLPGNRGQLDPKDRRESQEQWCVTSVNLYVMLSRLHVNVSIHQN